MASYADLGLSEYSTLTTEGFAALTLSESSDSGGSCIWSETLISALQTAVANLEAKIDLLASAIVNLQTHGDSAWASADTSALAKSSEISALAAGRTLADLAAPSDVQVETTSEVVEVTTQTVEVVSQTVDVSSLATSAELNLIYALLARWSVSGNVLTTLDGDGNVLDTYTLTRDDSGAITGVS